MAVLKPPRPPITRSSRSRSDVGRKGELSGKTGSASQRLRQRRVAAREAASPTEPPSSTPERDDLGIAPDHQGAAEATTAGSANTPLDASEAVENEPAEQSNDAFDAATLASVAAPEPSMEAEPSAGSTPLTDAERPRGHGSKRSSPSVG